MANGVTSFVNAPFINGVSSGTRIAPSVLDLGSYYLTRNPRVETALRLFARAAPGSYIAGLDSFVAVAASQNLQLPQGNSKQPPPGPNTVAGQAYAAALELLQQRDTPAQSYLRQLLSPRDAGTLFNVAPPTEETQNAAPLAIATNTGATAIQGHMTTLTGDQLAATSASSDRDIVYHLIDGPAGGSLQFAFAPGTPIVSFTQADLKAGLVQYVNRGTTASADGFLFSVSDGTGASQIGRFAINVTPDAAPQVTVNAGATVAEGASVAITAAQLSASDADNTNTSLRYNVTSGPANGFLALAGNPTVAITQFMQANLDAGQVIYVHDGSETTSDNFTFSVTDNIRTTSVSTFNISVTPVNDAPVLTNTGTTVAEGGTTTITTGQLNATDADTAANNLVYTVTSAPSNGQLQLSTNPGVAITSFTQADLAAGLVQYVHNGSEATSDAFTFSLSDGSTTLPDATFNISVTPVNDPPTLTTNSSLTVNEGDAAAINTTNLSASDADTPDNNLVYTITSGPANGQLEYVTSPGTAITSFTQADLAAGLVQYVHNGSETTSDSFTFSLSDGGTTLTGNTFNIGVNPVNDAPILATNTSATVAEGATTTITTAQLNVTDADTPDSNLVYTVVSSPANGQLQLSTNPGVSITSFTQADIAAGRVQYVHNGSETTSDNFTFTVSDGALSIGDTTFNINVAPMNDPPVLATNTGANVNEGATTTLTTAQLSATDVDTPDSSLVYTVTSAPSNGWLQLSTNPGAAITSFTQADLAAGRVQYVHNGSETTSDSFTFSLSDGGTTLSGNNFNISVNPVDDAPVVATNAGATVAEGSTVTLTTATLSASDVDTSNANLTFTVTSSPANGFLQFASNPGVAITSFTQADLTAGRVQYVHNGSETTSDSFTFRLSDQTTTLAPVNFNVTVTPVDDAPVLTTNTGTSVSRLAGSTIITTTQLNASDVDTSTSNVTFNITGGLAKGYIDLTTNPGVAVTSFTEADLLAGRVQYVHTAFGLSADSFTFTVQDQTTTLSSSTFSINVTV